jgi:hypothetical protein
MIVRIKKRTHPYVQIDKRPLENVALSWRAKGLYAYLLSRPNNWRIRMTQLATVSADGKTSLSNIMRELRIAGFARIEQVRSPNGKHAMGTEWVIYEHSQARDERISESLKTRVSATAESLPGDPP